MYTCPCRSQVIRWNLSRCLANLTLTNSRSYAVKSQDDFKIMQVSEKRKKEKDFLPGIEHRKDLLKEWNDSSSLYQNENEAISTDIDPEEFNSMKADFMNLDESYESFKREKFLRRNAKARKQVRSKHFREEKQPKMLTITEMYQINLLHKQDPVTWTPEKLSESFPATPQVILKVLGSHSPRSAKRMLQHDMDVKHNWSLLRLGQLVGLSPDYEHHLTAFSHRDPLVRTLEEYKAFQPPVFKYVPESTEFRSIITSYYDLLEAKKRLHSTVENANPSRLTEPASKLTTGEMNEKKQTDSGIAFETGSVGTGKYIEAGRQEVIEIGGNFRSNGTHLGSTYEQTVGRKRTNAQPAVNTSSRWFSSEASKSSSEGELKSEEGIKRSEREDNDRQEIDSSNDTLHEVNTKPTETNATRTDTFQNQEDNTPRKDSSSATSSEVPVSGSSTDMSSHVEADGKNNSSGSSSFDRNRTMHSTKPAYWQEMEQQRAQEEREKERVRAQVKQALEDRTTHSGQWRRLKPNTGFNQGFNSEHYDEETSPLHKYPARFDRHRMDLERIRRNRVSSLMFDEEEEPLPEERYERDLGAISHRASSKIVDEEFLQEERGERDRSAMSQEKQGYRERRERIVHSHYEDQEFLNRLNQRREMDGLVDREESTDEHVRADEADVDDGYREETADTLPNSVVHSPQTIDSAVTGGYDPNKRMYPRKPAYWDEITRRARFEEKQREKDVQAIHQEMEDKSMYDGKWRRLFPRTEIPQPRPEDSPNTVVPLSARRMDTLQNCDEDDDTGFQDTYHNEQLPQVATKPNTALDATSEDTENSEQVRPKFDYYLDEGVGTLSSKTHYTLDKLRTVLEKKKSQVSLDRDEEVLLTSYKTKEKFSDHSVEELESGDLSECIESDHLVERPESSHLSGGTQLTSYNTRQSIADPLYSGTVNYTGIVSHGVDITEQDVRVALSIHVEEKIEIPKELYKKDALYKVDDCFYDDNGEFLYRVPGLKNA